MLSLNIYFDQKCYKKGVGIKDIVSDKGEGGQFQ